MKTMFQRLHRTAFVAFPLLSILLILSGMLFGSWPVVLIVLWFISLGLLIMVLLACIVQNVSRHWQAGTIRKLILRYLAVAAAAFAVLVVLDLFAERVLWSADLGVGLLVGLLGLYGRP